MLTYDQLGIINAEINFLAINCSICGQAIHLQLHLVLGGLAKPQVQQAQIDLR